MWNIKCWYINVLCSACCAVPLQWRGYFISRVDCLLCLAYVLRPCIFCIALHCCCCCCCCRCCCCCCWSFCFVRCVAFALAASRCSMRLPLTYIIHKHVVYTHRTQRSAHSCASSPGFMVYYVRHTVYI